MKKNIPTTAREIEKMNQERFPLLDKRCNEVSRAITKILVDQISRLTFWYEWNHYQRTVETEPYKITICDHSEEES